MLIGRGSERLAVDALLDDARDGRGGTLVLRGEPGIGKTALLDYAGERAPDLATLRALGVETESELAYSGLYELLGPLLALVDDLPPQQARALRASLALESAVDVDRFGVYVAILSLLASASAAAPVLCVVDDAQWIDRSSLEALRFVSRRLRGDRVAFLLAAREGEPRTFEAPELPSLYLEPLHDEAAAELLDLSSPGIAPELRSRVLQTSGGNPLALLEIPRHATSPPGEASPLPVGRRVEQAFLGRVRVLSPDAQHALLVAAAAEPTEGAFVRAVVSDALDEAERSGLLATENGVLRFAHPLVRSAVYSAADPVGRRAAHKALAVALAAAGETELSAWQAAAAASSPDEDVAAALELAAESAGARGGEIVQAHALERAAKLTPDRDRRARRLLKSAEASWSIGLERVETLCREALRLTEDAALRGDVHAQLETALYWRGDLPAAHRIKVETADALEDSAPVQSAHMRARSTASMKHMLRGQEAVEIAGRALETMRAAGGDDPRVPLMYAQALARAGATARARELVDEWTPSARAAPDVSLRINASEILALQDDLSSAEALVDEWLRPARAAGDVSTLTNALEYKARIDSYRGRFVAAHAAALESLELTELVPAEVLQRAESAVRLSVVLSLLGREDGDLSGEALRLSVRCSSAFLEAEARAGLGRLALSLGRPDEAIGQLERVRTAVRGGGYRHPAFVQFSPELVLAYVRAGRLEDASEELRLLTEEAQLTAMPWALAAAARSRGLLAADDDFDAAFAEAADHHSRSPRVVETALTQLLYGERLRRAGRRTEARVQLRTALETFETAGAAAWAERARDELAATGEHVRRVEGGRDDLTPQELQVAYAVSAGATNKDVAAQLFLSPKTIEFHLRNAYRKLGVSSRTQLANTLRQDGSHLR